MTIVPYQRSRGDDIRNPMIVTVEIQAQLWTLRTPPGHIPSHAPAPPHVSAPAPTSPTHCFRLLRPARVVPPPSCSIPLPPLTPSLSSSSSLPPSLHPSLPPSALLRTLSLAPLPSLSCPSSLLFPPFPPSLPSPAPLFLLHHPPPSSLRPTYSRPLCPPSSPSSLRRHLRSPLFGRIRDKYLAENKDRRPVRRVRGVGASLYFRNPSSHHFASLCIRVSESRVVIMA